jgi:hypothetical protein
VLNSDQQAKIGRKPEVAEELGAMEEVHGL